MREIKFRAWSNETNKWLDCSYFSIKSLADGNYGSITYQQFTGLKDKEHNAEVYEGDIIDEYGNIKGNCYEMDKGETDLLIEGFGTAAWWNTEKAGLARGLKYAE